MNKHLHQWSPAFGWLFFLFLTGCVSTHLQGDGPSNHRGGGFNNHSNTGDVLSGGSSTKTPSAKKVHVRPEINQMDPNGPKVAALRRGITVMKNRPTTDPTSWNYQANIHGTYDEQNLPAWETCKHGSYFFLSWHRVYLYYFERILREASGDETLTLPYWNYSDPRNRALPQILRQPADASNPLFVAERARGVNEGAKLSDADVAFQSSLELTNFTASGSMPFSFGGQFRQAPGPHFSNGFGSLERQPHNVIHVALGGRRGWMSDPNMAARDPIFWFHHANIDRLWEMWIQKGEGRRNPTGDESWMQTEFEFFDENGDAVYLSGAEILHISDQLGYRYAGMPAPSTATPERPAVPSPETPTTPPRRLGTSINESISLEGQRIEVEIALPPAAEREMAQVMARESAGGGPVVALNLEGLEMRQRGVRYQVYLNLPEDTAPDPTGPYYVANLALFLHLGDHSEGHSDHSDGHSGGDHGEDHGGKLTESFPIDPVIRALKARGEWTGEVTLTFVEGALEMPPGIDTGREAATKGPNITFEKATITSH